MPMTASHIRGDMFAEFISPRRKIAEETPTAQAAEASGMESAISSGEEPALLKLLQAIETHGGEMTIQTLLQVSQLPTLATLQQLGQLKKNDFVQVIPSAGEDTVQLTTLGRWAAKYT